MIVNPGTGGQGGAPGKHAQQHGKNGADPLTPAAIGAAAVDHSHTPADIGAANADHTHTPESIGAAGADHTHTPASIGAAAVDHIHTPASIGAAEKNHSHTAADVGARQDNWMPTAEETGAVPKTRKINGKALDVDVTLSASDVGAAEENHNHTGYAASNHSHTPSEVGAVPTIRKVNGKALSADISLTASDVGAAAESHSHSNYAPSSHSHTPADVGALPISGGTLTGNLTLKGSGNFGTQINLGDGDYVHIAEPTDDCLEIKAKKINFVVSDTTDAKFTLNGEKIGGSGGVTSFNGRTGAITPASGDYTAAQVGAAPSNHTHTPASIGAAAADHTHPAQTTITGNAGTATKLATARTIDGMSFDGSAAVKHYGTCATTAATAAKTVTLAGFSLVSGARIAVKFTYTNTAASPTLNVNSTGAKEIVKYGTAAAGSGAWSAGEVVEFVYDGTRFVIVDGAAREKAMSGGSAVEAGDATPKVAGTGAVGTSEKYAREDHVHPKQTTVTGNAGTATKLATARTIDGVDFNGSAAITHFGTCDTAADTSVKTVSCTGFKLVTGARIAVKFTYQNTLTNPQLNVNGTGAKLIKSHATAGFAETWGEKEVVEFVYDGQFFMQISGYTSYYVHNVAVPKNRTINGKALSYNITLTAADVGAMGLGENKSISAGGSGSFSGINEAGVYLFAVESVSPVTVAPSGMSVGSTLNVALRNGKNVTIKKATSSSFTVTNNDSAAVNVALSRIA